MSKPVYSFAGVELDTSRRQLRGGGQTRDVPPQVFGALEFLARNGNEIVTKEDLANALWPDRIVTDASVSQVIRKARVALEDCGANPELIKTQHGHGYRLDADVSIGEAADSRSEWQQHPFRTGAVLALLGGILVTLANISDVLQWVIPDDSAELLEETQSALASTDAKVDEVVRLLREQAARSGAGLDPDSETTIRAAVAAIVSSVDARKKDALEQLSAGNIEAAADSIVAVASDLDSASAQSVAAAVDSWREAGALYYTNNIDKAVNSYESAHRLSPDDPEIALELGYAYVRAGRLQDAISLFEVAASPEAAADLRSDALRGAGIALKLQGEFDDASMYFERALAVADEANDRRRRSLVLLQQGALARARGDNQRALDLFETAVGYAEEFGDQNLLARSLNNLGIALAVVDRAEPSIDALERAREIHVSRHDLAGQAEALGNLGAVALLQQDLETAESYLLESVAIGERLSWPRSIALDLINLASIAASRQEFGVATERLDRALDIAVSTQLNEVHPIILVNKGEVARDRGNDAEACQHWQEALPLLQAMQHAAVATVVGYQDDLNCPRG